MLLRRLVLASFLACAVVTASPAVAPLTAGGPQQTAPVPTKTPDVIYVPTPEVVVEAMLKLAHVTKDDVIYDLGCGDGRFIVTAAKRFGARGVGIDIDPERIAEARANARKEGVSGRVRFVEQDLFEADIHEATVVTLYLLPSLNLKLRPKLWKDLAPGTRIVSHAFDMGDWKPEQTQLVDGRDIYLWRIKKPM
jgi:SAM-dependent methyltransferase